MFDTKRNEMKDKHTYTCTLIGGDTDTLDSPAPAPAPHRHQQQRKIPLVQLRLLREEGCRKERMANSDHLLANRNSLTENTHIRMFECQVIQYIHAKSKREPTHAHVDAGEE